MTRKLESGEVRTEKEASIEPQKLETLKRSYIALKELWELQQSEAIAFEDKIKGILDKDKTKKVDLFYAHRLRDLKIAIRALLVAIDEAVPEALKRRWGAPVILELEKENKKDKYILTVRSIHADKRPGREWTPDQMTLEYFAQSGDFFSRGYVAGEVQKYKYWYTIPWAKDILQKVIPEYAELIQTKET